MSRPLAVMTVMGLVAATLSPLSASTAHACTCVPIEDVAEPVGWSDVILIGTVTSMRTTGSAPGWLDKDAVVSVQSYLKGSGPSEIVADDGFGDADCGMFKDSYIGREMLLFLDVSDDVFTTTSCSGNRVIEGDPLQDPYVVAVMNILNPTALPPTGGFPPPTNHAAAFPAVTAATLAILIPAAVLSAAALWPRR